MTKEPHDSGPPRWKGPNDQEEFLNRPLPDPAKGLCGMPNCGKAKFLVRNQATDRYSDTYYCQDCDGDLG